MTTCSRCGTDADGQYECSNCGRMTAEDAPLRHIEHDGELTITGKNLSTQKSVDGTIIVWDGETRVRVRTNREYGELTYAETITVSGEVKDGIIHERCQTCSGTTVIEAGTELEACPDCLGNGITPTAYSG